MSELIQKLAAFLAESPVSYHAIRTIQRRLDAAGFTELRETEAWSLAPGQAGYVVRNGSSIIAFRLPKPEPVLKTPGAPARLNVEAYGGMIRSSWFDRPLSVAGRVLVDTGRALEQRLVAFDRDLAMIPSLAVHLSRDERRQGDGVSVQRELLPILGDDMDNGAWLRLLAEQADTEPERILGSDLFLTCRMPATIWGARGEFFSAPRLDDLACCFGALEGFLHAEVRGHAALYCVFDNEEVGSRSMQGAESTFLSGVTRRLLRALGGFDVAAAGVVLKHQAGQRYTTDAASEAVFKRLCRRYDIPYQEYVNHGDVPGGSTLGNISNTQLSVRSVDIGLAQLAMHSAFETMGADDFGHLSRFAEAFCREPLPQIET